MAEQNENSKYTALSDDEWRVYLMTFISDVKIHVKEINNDAKQLNDTTNALKKSPAGLMNTIGMVLGEISVPPPHRFHK